MQQTENMDIVEQLIKEYEKCTKEIKRKFQTYHVRLLNQALATLIQIIEVGRLQEVDKYIVYNLLLMGKIYAKKAKLKTNYGNIDEGTVRLYANLATLEELSIKQEVLVLETDKS